MRLTTLILASCICFFSHPLIIHSEDNHTEPTISIFKLDGTNHCDSYPGVELDSMKLKLTTNGITVFSTRKGYDGREGIAICGAPTGQINIYEITSSDLPAALSLGFKQLSKN